MELNYADPDYIDAMNAYLSGHWREAEPKFQALCETYEKSTFVRLMLGDVYYSCGKLDSAVKMYHAAILLNPEFNLAYYKLGVCFYRKGHLRHALEAFQRVASGPNSHALANYFIGLIHMYLGNDEDAAKGFEAFKVQSEESIIANMYLAQLRVKAKKYEEALPLLLELAEQTPHFAEVHYMLGTVYYGMHDNAKAVQSFRKALDINPADERTKTKLTLLTDIQFI